MTGTDELGDEVAGRLADRAAALLANHGLVTVGSTPAKALHAALVVERTAQIVWGARLLGRHPRPAAEGQQGHRRRLPLHPRPAHVRRSARVGAPADPRQSSSTKPRMRQSVPHTEPVPHPPSDGTYCLARSPAPRARRSSRAGPPGRRLAL